MTNEIKLFNVSAAIDYLQKNDLWTDPGMDLSPVELYEFCENLIITHDIDIKSIENHVLTMSDEGIDNEIPFDDSKSKLSGALNNVLWTELEEDDEEEDIEDHGEDDDSLVDYELKCGSFKAVFDDYTSTLLNLHTKNLSKKLDDVISKSLDVQYTRWTVVHEEPNILFSIDANQISRHACSKIIASIYKNTTFQEKLAIVDPDCNDGYLYVLLIGNEDSDKINGVVHVEFYVDDI